jgi:hypothetical protein
LQPFDKPGAPQLKSRIAILMRLFCAGAIVFGPLPCAAQVTCLGFQDHL